MILRGTETAALLAALHGRCFPPDGRWGAAAMHELLGMPGCAAVVDGQPPAAMAMLRTVAGEAELLTLGVRSGARRRGLGRAVLREAMAEAARNGAERMLLEVAEGNAAALALYGNAGFRTVGSRRNYYPDGGDAVVMAAALSAVAGRS